jgi:hypothetical protein
MPKWKVRAWYSVPRWKEIEVDAPDERTAYKMGEALVENEDTSSWQEWSDAEVQVDVRAIYRSAKAQED